MTTNSNSTESNNQTTETTTTTTTTDTSATGYETTPPKTEDQTQEPEKELFGYDDLSKKDKDDVVPEDKKPSEEEKPSEEDETPKEKVTGYDKEVKPPEEEKPQDDKEVENDDEGVEDKEVIKQKISELPDTYNKELISKFAEDHKLTKAQVDAYVELEKKENAEILKRIENNKQQTRANWQQELRDDKDFGGENFDRNVDRVEKVLEKYMPDTKKMLTERGSMMPPYIMKDLLRLDKALNPSAPLVGGEKPTPAKESKGNFLDEMYE